jgi:hypothetical protein
MRIKTHTPNNISLWSSCTSRAIHDATVWKHTSQGNRTKAQIHNQFSEILTREETEEEVTKPQVLLLCLSLSQPTQTATLQYSIGEKPWSAIANLPKNPKRAPTKPSQIPVSLFGTSKERQKSPAEEKKDVPTHQERYRLPEQDLHQQEHPKELLTTCSYQHHRSASSMIPRW